MLYFTYIMASERQGTLYIGMTNDLVRRVWEHKNHCVKGFTTKYNISNLVWFEIHATAQSAISAEKRMKRYRRKWKVDLIEKENPNWIDLYDTISSP
ncbi:MAG: GIY-YIG nuclease family protein [Kordiimonadaceae bacterium]|jgi:putative endonuclease|nr:GIY-YIG nuclease family protein [Kordiimonadaceae bacterium]